ncbi:MAG: PAS domain S-box protein [Deltaproteobacteria bacterium]|nr:PAS domain S-box protein [Deltaproteobacteria bacterium]
MDDKRKTRTHPVRNFVLIGIILAIVFWLLESAMHAYIFGRSNLMAELVPADSNELWMRSVISLLFIGFGVYADMMINRRRAAEEALASSEEKYRRIIETSEEGVWVIDGSGRTAFVNKKMAEMLGATPGEMAGRHLFDFMDTESVKSAEAYLERRKSGIREQHDFRFKRKDGGDLWAIVSTTPITGPDGEYAGALAMITDITERKRAEESLRSTNELYSTLAKTAEEAIFIVGRPYSVLFVNASAANLLDSSPEGATGRALEDLLPESTLKAARPLVDSVFNTGKPCSYEGGFTLKGKEIWLDTSLAPLFDEAGGVKAVMGIAHDTTKRRKSEGALRERVEELERFRRVTVDRELRLRELKDRVVFLEAELDKVNGHGTAPG